MAQSPQTTATIYSLKSCDPTYKNVMYFPDGISVSNRLASMSVKTPLSYTNLQYIRDDGYVELPVIYDTAHDYNYIMYNNGEGEGSIFAFITNVEFLNFECTRFYIKKDVWLNYYKTANKTALIERTHSNTIPYISDINVTADKVLTPIFIDNKSTYYFSIVVVFNDVTSLDDTLCPARTMNFIYKVENNTITPYGKTNKFSALKHLTGSSKVGAWYIYYVPTEMLTLFTAVEWQSDITVGGDIKLMFTGYSIKRKIPVRDYVSNVTAFQRTYSKERIAVFTNDMFDRYPYSKVTISCSSGEYEVPTEYFKDGFTVNTFPIEGVNGMTFRHDIFAKGCTLTVFERAAQMPFVTNSFTEFMEYNSSYGARQMTTAITQLASSMAGVYLTGTATAKSFSTGSMSYEQQRNILGNKMVSGGAGILGTVSDTIYTLEDYKNRPDKIDPSGDSEKCMTYALPNMFVIRATTINNDLKNYCKSVWNSTGFRFKSIKDMIFNVGKYYTYIKVESYSSNIRNKRDAQEFESILMNGTTIWNMTNANDYKEYGNYVSYEENIIS